MGDKNFTEELEQIFTYIKENLIKEFPTDKITVEYFMLSVLENDTSIAYKSLSRTMLNESMDVMKEWYYKYLANNTRQITDNYQFDNELKHYIDLSDVEKEKLNLDKINSACFCVLYLTITKMLHKVSNMSVLLIHNYSKV